MAETVDFNPFPRQDVRSIGFTGMQLDGDFSGDVVIDHGIKSEHTCCTEVFRKIDSGNFRSGVCNTGGKAGCNGSGCKKAPLYKVTAGNIHMLPPKIP